MQERFGRPIIAALVQLFKRASFVAQYPKATALILATVIALVQGLTFRGLDWTMIAECVLIPFAAAVATYEVVKTATVKGA